jgi:hypothetical protein
MVMLKNSKGDWYWTLRWLPNASRALVLELGVVKLQKAFIVTVTALVNVPVAVEGREGCMHIAQSLTIPIHLI